MTSSPYYTSWVFITLQNAQFLNSATTKKLVIETPVFQKNLSDIIKSFLCSCQEEFLMFRYRNVTKVQWKRCIHVALNLTYGVT